MATGAKLQVQAVGPIPDAVHAAMDRSLDDTVREITSHLNSTDETPSEFLGQMQTTIDSMDHGQVRSMLSWALTRLVMRDNPGLATWWNPNAWCEQYTATRHRCSECDRIHP